MIIKNLFLVVFGFVILSASCGKGGGNDPDPTPPIDTTPVNTNTFTNPLLSSGPDPWVAQKDGFYYYTHTLGNKVALWKVNKIDELKNSVPVTV